MVVCPNCGRESPDDARFCAGCGRQLETSRSREERKVVTVLFADIVGSTARAQRLDPEDVRAELSTYYARVRAELERYGGTVEKFIGDAVMAVFGAPTAHEDDPERAVRAALTIRGALADSDVDVRIAVHTGEALVALGANAPQGEGMVAGDVVNTAARMQAAAPVNGILVGEATYRGTTHVIEYRDVEPIEAKGKAEPVPVWEAIAPRSRLGVDVDRGATTRLVGREDELALLAGALARVRREREPQLVTLVGVPGIGKSRLVAELLEAVEADPDLITWRQGRCLPYGDGVAFWALGEMAKAQAGVFEEDSSEVAEAKLHAAVASLITAPTEAEWVVGHVRPLLGLVGVPATADRRSDAFAAWRRFFEALGERGPTVLVFEDLHWADDGLLDFVDHLADWASGVPLLIVGSARPELLARRPGWGGGKANSATLSLSPLSDTQIARLVAQLLERSLLPAETQSELLARAGGNPLYAEEYVRMLADGRFADEALPETVQGIIAARLDALSSDEKALIQDAAVVGKVFWSGALATVGELDRTTAENHLHALERKEFVRRERTSSVAAETEYAFRHVLVRDVAYGQIPRAGRAEKHRRAAEWIESLGAERAEDRAEMLAHHYGAALEFARASGQETEQLGERARFAFRDAAERAFSLNALLTAVRLFEHAIALWPEDDEAWPRLVLRHAQARMIVLQGREYPLLAHARDRLLAAGSIEAAAEAELVLAEVEWFHGESDKAFVHFGRAGDLVRDRPASISKARVLAETSRFLMLANRGDEAIRWGREAGLLAEALGLQELQANSLNNIGVARVSSGDIDGLRDIERSIEIAEAVNSSERFRGVGNLASLASDTGDLRRSRKLYEQNAERAGRLGYAGWVMWAQAELALLSYYEGDWAEALAGAEKFLAETADEAHYMQPPARMTRAAIAIARGDVATAVDDADQATAFARSARDPQALYPMLATAARIHADAGRLVSAAEHADELLALATKDDFHANSWVLELSFVLVRLGRADEAASFFARPRLSTRWLEAARPYASGDAGKAADVLADMGATALEAYARLAAAEAGADRLHLDAAIAFYRSVGANGFLRRADALFPATA